MPKSRREFLKQNTVAFLGLSQLDSKKVLNQKMQENPVQTSDNQLSIIGHYGSWFNHFNEEKLPKLSFRNNQFKSLSAWKVKVRKHLLERMGYRKIESKIEVKVLMKIEYDGLSIEQLEYQLPYGRPTRAYVLKPLGETRKMPGILAFHDHSGHKYFGGERIIKTSDNQHHSLSKIQESIYEGTAWANEMAKQGYVVFVPDAFAFGSRRVHLQDVPAQLRGGLVDDYEATEKGIDDYNRWANNHESIMARSLFSAGTSWPAVFMAEDQVALDLLCQRNDVDASKIGCCGLSGGGLRTVYLSAVDERIKVAIPVGFMTTWRDLSMNKAHTHTWMTYTPMLPNELDFPEILSLRAPLPTLVLNNNHDQLFTLEEMQKCDEILTVVFEKAKSKKDYKTSFYDGSHKFDKAMQKEAAEWFERYLK